MFLTIKYKSQSKKFQWKRTFSITKFKSLLTQVFALKSNVQGLISSKGSPILFFFEENTFLIFFKKGKFIDFQSLIDNPHLITTEPYELLVEPNTFESFRKPALPNSLPTFQETSATFGFNRNVPPHQENKNVNLIENFSDFEENYLYEVKKNKVTAVFFFNTNDESTNFFMRFSHILDRFSSTVDYFNYVTYLVEIPESELRDKVFLAPPCLLVYIGRRKQVEMSLDLMGENLMQILRKIENNFSTEQRSKKNSEESNSTSIYNNGTNKTKSNMDRINEKYFKFLERMLKGRLIIEREYFYLKSLFFQDSQLIINNCLESLS